MSNSIIKANYNGSKIMAGGVLYEDVWYVLYQAAIEWRNCARAVVRSAQEDTDWAYRLMGARAAQYRRRVARALYERASMLYHKRREATGDDSPAVFPKEIKGAAPGIPALSL